MFLHWVERLLVGGVSSNHVLLIQLWKLNMWQHQRQLRKRYGVIAKAIDPMILYCDNSGVVA